jgi:hypothetical protein
VQNAKAVANSLVNGNCELAHAQVFVNAVTEASYTNIQGCAQKDSSSGNASGSTGGSTAESVRSPSDVVVLHRSRHPGAGLDLRFSCACSGHLARPSLEITHVCFACSSHLHPKWRSGCSCSCGVRRTGPGCARKPIARWLHLRSSALVHVLVR